MKKLIAAWRNSMHVAVVMAMLLFPLSGVRSDAAVTPQEAQSVCDYVADHPAEAASNFPDVLYLGRIREVVVTSSRIPAGRGYRAPEPDKGAPERWLAELPAGTAVVVFVGTGAHHCVYLADRHGFRAFAAASVGQDELAALQARWRAAAGVDRTDGRRAVIIDAAVVGAGSVSRQEAGQALEGFEQMLFPKRIIQKLASYHRVLIAPYGDLGAAPYEALPVSPGRMLVDTTSVVVLPGLEFSRLADWSAESPRGQPACARSRPGWRSPVVVGDPQYLAGSGLSLPDLPGARSEVGQVAAIYHVRPLTGRQATRGALLQSAGKASILHIATHGVSLPDAPLQSYLAMADGPLKAQDIQTSCLAGVRVAVLSACQTGLGKAVDGGFIGLARAFYLAGVDDVVMSLWSVDDEATTPLMVEFAHEETQEDITPDEALRQAMLKVRKKDPDATHWAAFSVFGSTLRHDQGRIDSRDW